MGNTSNSAYKTFGEMLSRQRADKDMTEQALADATNQKLPEQDEAHITAEDVAKWEAYKSVPQNHIVLLLAKVLISENVAQGTSEKKKLFTEFMEAAETSRAALKDMSKMASPSYKDVVAVTSFAEMLNRLTLTLGVDQEGLLERVNAAIDAKHPKPIGKGDVLSYQEGGDVPEDAVLNAMIEVLELPADGNVHSEMKDAYASARKEAVVKRFESQSVALHDDFMAFLERQGLHSEETPFEWPSGTTVTKKGQLGTALEFKRVTPPQKALDAVRALLVREGKMLPFASFKDDWTNEQRACAREFGALESRYGRLVNDFKESKTEITAAPLSRAA